MKQKGHFLEKLFGVGILFSTFFFDFEIPNVSAYRDVGGFFLDQTQNPITTPLDFRVSLWDDYFVRSGDINGDGTINTSALHYGTYQTTFTGTPDSRGFYRFEMELLPSFPVLSPFNSFLQLEYKDQGAADTTYQLYDFLDDPPLQNVTRMLLDENSVYYVNDAGPRTNWNTFTLDANNNAATAVTLQFGETLAKTLKYVIASTQFELNDDVSITGGLTLSATLTANGGVTLGDNGDTVAVNSSAWDVSTAGVGSGFTGFASIGVIDFNAASSFLPPQGSSDPASCNEGQVFYNSTSNVLKVCNATNVWTTLNGAQRSYSAVGSPAFNTSRTPSTSSDTFVIATVTMNIDDGENSTITAQVDTGAGFTTIATVSDDFDVTGIGVGGTHLVKHSLSFVVPANSSYKIVSSGTGANTLDAVQELGL